MGSSWGAGSEVLGTEGGVKEKTENCWTQDDYEKIPFF